MNNFLQQQQERREFLAHRLRLARLAKGFSQEFVALELGMAQRTISSYENAITMPDYCLLIELAEFYEVSTHYFFPEPGSMKISS